MFVVIKYGGALYLVYLGVRTMRGSGGALAPRPMAGATGTGWRMLVRGVALQAANPKALLFFVALLPQFVNAREAAAPQFVILGVTDVAVEFVVLELYGYGASRAATLSNSPRFVNATNRLSGGMLVLAGTAIGLTSDK